MVVYFAFLFHMYQPPVQIAPVIKQIVKESYQPVLEAIYSHPEVKITLNINGILTEQFIDYRHDELIQKITSLASLGQIEFTESGKYHPLLPLIPEPEIKRQIRLNHETNQRYFGDVYKPKGFFPPEMAISEEVLETVHALGLEWIIMSGIANTLPTFPINFISQHSNGLKLIFRDDYISVDLAFDKINSIEAFFQRLKYTNSSQDTYIILAMDIETFGHHIKGAIKKFLIPLFDVLPNRDDVKLYSISEIVRKFPLGEKQFPRDSTWSTMPGDIAHDLPYPLWFDPNNPLHVEQHKLFMYGLTLINLATKYENSMNSERKSLFYNARHFIDRGIHSCQQWWASKKPYYSPDMILRGLNEILIASVNAKRCIPDGNPDIKDAMELIMTDMLKSHDKIVLSL